MPDLPGEEGRGVTRGRGCSPPWLSLPIHPASLLPLPLGQAWYREGLAAEGLKQWEDAAVAFFEAYNLDPQRTAFVGKFRAAVDAGRKEHVEAARK